MGDRPNYYAIIPALVRYADISDKAKLLYGELTALSNKEGYCWATNSYFANLYGVDNKTITRNIKELEDKGLIHIRYDYNKKETKRYIYIVSMDKNVPTICSGDKNVSTDKNVSVSGDKNVPHNNTSNNNTIYTTGAEREETYKKLEEYIPSCNIVWFQAVDKYLDKMPYELVIRAIQETAEANKRDCRYFRAICERWLSENYKTLEEVENDKYDFQSKRQKSQELKDKAREAYIKDVEYKNTKNISKKVVDRDEYNKQFIKAVMKNENKQKNS